MQDAAGAALGVLLPHPPTVPSHGKWEKLVPSMLFFFKLQVHDILDELLKVAFENASFLSKQAGMVNTDDIQDPTLRNGYVLA